MRSNRTRSILTAAAVIGMPMAVLIGIQFIPLTAQSLHTGMAQAEPDPLSLSFAVAAIPRVPASLVLPNSAPGQAGSSVKSKYLASPLYFEANLGQTDPRVKYIARGSGYGLYLAKDEVVLALQRTENRKKASSVRPSAPAQNGPVGQEAETTVVRTRFIDASPAAQIEGKDPRETRLNYFIGNDPARWNRGVRCYGSVSYGNLYPGIDLVFYGNQRQLEYDFILSPGSDPARIRMEMQGADRLAIDRDGNLVLHTPAGEIRQHKPLISQTVAGTRREVKGRFVIRSEKEIGFEVDSYDRTRPLTIDPIFSYYTLLGGSGDDRIFAVAADPAGNLYVTGETTSTNFPTTPGSHRTTLTDGSKDLFVAKFNKTLTSLLYSTYVGGAGIDSATGIGVDTFGNATVTGSTTSANFPTTTNAFQAARKGTTDTFFFRLSPAGDSLLYSTYLGGSGIDTPATLVLEPSGRVFITGTTDSDDFPVIAGAYQSTRKGKRDGFICRFSPLGSLIASSYFGGAQDEDSLCMAATAGGLVYLGGDTASTDYPVTSDALQGTNGGGAFDGFITVLGVGEGVATGIDPSIVGTVRDGDMRLLYSTYIGGSGTDWVSGITYGPDAGIYAGGTTNSTNFPVTTGANIRGGQDIFLARLPGIGGAISRAPVAGEPGLAQAPSEDPSPGPTKKVIALQGSGDDTLYSMWFANTYLGIVADSYSSNFLNVGLYPSPGESYVVQGFFDRGLNQVRSVGQYGLESASSRSGGNNWSGDTMTGWTGGRLGYGVSDPPPTGYQKIFGGGQNDGYVSGQSVLQPDSTVIFQAAPLNFVKGSTPATTSTPGYAIIDFYPRRINSTAIARGPSGAYYSDTGVSGIYTDSLAPFKQNVYVADQKMGSGLYNQSRSGWIQWRTPGTAVGMFLNWNQTFTEVDGGPISQTPQRTAVMPWMDSIGNNQVTVFNPGSYPATGYVQAINNSGTTTWSRSFALSGCGSSTFTIYTSNSPELGEPGKKQAAAQESAYVQVRGSSGLISFMNFGRPNQYLATIAGLDADEGGLKLFSPQYAVGQDYISILSIVNLDSTAGNITAQLFKDNGTAWAPAKQMPIGAKGRVVISDPKFFVDPGSSLVQGYVTISSDGPRLVGSVFFGDPNLKAFGTTLPLVSTLLNRIIFAQLASDKTWYTGIAALNPNAATANAVMNVYDPAGGTPKYTKNIVLAPGERTVGVLTQFFPQLVGLNLSSGFITVISDRPLAGFALYGTGTSADLAAVPAQKMP